MAGVVHVTWYSTVLRQEALAAEISAVAPLAMRHGATKYAVHRSNDDRYKILQMTWFENTNDWYRYWEGPEMIEFRARNTRHFQIPVVYVWYDELAAGEMGPEVPLVPEGEPEPEPVPPAAA
jgi:hypothetical protein